MDSPQILPAELMELQLAQIELLLAMYPDEDSTSMNEETKNVLAKLQEGDDALSSLVLPPVICVTLKLCIQESSFFHLEISFPLRYTHCDSQYEVPRPGVRLRQPSWMTNIEYSSLMVARVDDDGDLLSQIELIQEALDKLLSDKVHIPAENEQRPDSEQKPIVRAWFYFPSISTRSKRDDIVKHAPSYGLTGFLLAGKPGVLCFEGEPSAIDEFMAFIKTESWGDIPAAHKKVSERLREAIVNHEEKIFKDMREITDEIGERRGERANRSDMKALEAWLGQKGLQQSLKQVLM